jgi:Methylamine utilisation protein MauE
VASTELLLRDFVGAFLIFAALTKAFDRANARASLALHFGPRRATPVFYTTVLAEIGSGAWLLSGEFPALGLAVTGSLLLVFTAVLLDWRLRGLQTTCGCFGLGIPSRVSWPSVIRNATLAAVCFALLSGRSITGVEGGIGASAVWLIFPLIAGPVTVTSLTSLEALRMIRRADREPGVR